MQSKVISAILGLLVVVASIGLVFAFVQNNKKTADETDTKIELVDPDGTFSLYSDPSITVPPENDMEIGGGKPLIVGYDRSKGENLFYQLYYVNFDGVAQPMTSGLLNYQGSNSFGGNFTITDASALSSGTGYLELSVVAPDVPNVKLGMYKVKFVE